MYAIVGIGQAGNVIADLAFQRGIPAMGINYSSKDLDSCKALQLKVKLYGSEGVGKDREEAKRLLGNNAETVVDYMKQHFNKPSIEVIFLVFSTGGGSGSGISPLLLEVLTQTMDDKVFVAVPILPGQKEVVVNQVNSFNTFSELSELGVCILPIDNQKVNVGAKNKLYKTVNEMFINTLEELFSYTEKDSVNGNLDNKDLLNIFNTNGIATISETTITDLNNEPINLSDFSVAKAIQNSWDHSIFAEIEYDQIIKAGVITDIQESLVECINHDMIFDKFTNYPIDLFEGTYHNQNGKIITVLTGLSWPETRMKHIQGLIEEKKYTLQSVMNVSNKKQSKINLNDLNPQIRKKENKKKMSLDDILKKYD